MWLKHPWMVSLNVAHYNGDGSKIWAFFKTELDIGSMRAAPTPWFPLANLKYTSIHDKFGPPQLWKTRSPGSSKKPGESITCCTSLVEFSKGQPRQSHTSNIPMGLWVTWECGIHPIKDPLQ